MRLIDLDVLIEKLEWLEEYDHIVFHDVKLSIDEVPLVNAIPVRWIKKYEKHDDLAASIYRMLEAWGADLSDIDEAWEGKNR